MAEKIEHRIGVKAPAETVWAFLSDLTTWSDWNPLYPQASGILRIGAPLTLTLALPGQAARTITPTVIDWVPREQIHWRLSAMGGLVRTVRYLEIEALNEESCVFSNGEIFMGLLGPRTLRQLKRPIRQGFAALGEAVRDRAERVWREEGGAPTSAS